MIIQHIFLFLNWTTPPPKMDLAKNAIFNRNIDLVLLTLMKLIILDLIVLVCKFRYFVVDFSNSRA